MCLLLILCSAVGEGFLVVWCAGWDLNPHCLPPEGSASCRWATCAHAVNFVFNLRSMCGDCRKALGRTLRGRRLTGGQPTLLSLSLLSWVRDPYGRGRRMLPTKLVPVGGVEPPVRPTMSASGNLHRSSALQSALGL